MMVAAMSTPKTPAPTPNTDSSFGLSASGPKTIFAPSMAWTFN